MLSHELRSPMNAMLGWIRILKTAGAQDTDLVRRAVETIERNIGVQAQTVNDLLDMSRILSGKLQLEQGRVEFAAVVTGCIQSLRPSAEDKQIALRLNVKDEELDVLGDEARLQQVVANLLGNAIKFTDAGASSRSPWNERTHPRHWSSRTPARESRQTFCLTSLNASLRPTLGRSPQETGRSRLSAGH